MVLVPQSRQGPLPSTLKIVKNIQKFEGNLIYGRLAS